MKIVDFDKLFKSRKNKKIVYLIDLLLNVILENITTFMIKFNILWLSIKGHRYNTSNMLIETVRKYKKWQSQKKLKMGHIISGIYILSVGVGKSKKKGLDRLSLLQKITRRPKA